LSDFVVCFSVTAVGPASTDQLCSISNSYTYDCSELPVAFRPDFGSWPPLKGLRYHTYWTHSVDTLGRLHWTSKYPDTETCTSQHTTLTRDKHPCPRRDSNPHSHKDSTRRPTPYTVQSLGPANVQTICFQTVGCTTILKWESLFYLIIKLSIY
jgi:hypothetical protein